MAGGTMAGGTHGSGSSLHGRADDAVGRLVESLIRGHHRRRSAILDTDPTTAVDAASSPVREGNSVEIFGDGHDAFAGMLAMIEGAQRSVHIAGWHATPDFELTRGSIPKALGDALRVAAERARVRVLLWGCLLYTS